MAWTFCISGAAIAKAGTHANSTLIAYGDATILDGFSEQAEGRIGAETRRAWSGSYTSLPTEIRGILNDIASSLIAINIIGYDTTGYLSREADTLLNINDGIATSGLKILKDFKSNEIKTP